MVEELNDFKGGTTENYVNVQLTINVYTTYYWESDHGGEVDFVIQREVHALGLKLYAECCIKRNNLFPSSNPKFWPKAISHMSARRCRYTLSGSWLSYCRWILLHDGYFYDCSTTNVDYVPQEEKKKLRQDWEEVLRR